MTLTLNKLKIRFPYEYNIIKEPLIFVLELPTLFSYKEHLQHRHHLQQSLQEFGPLLLVGIRNLISKLDIGHFYLRTYDVLWMIFI